MVRLDYISGDDAGVAVKGGRREMEARGARNRWGSGKGMGHLWIADGMREN
jgi:hypothetical protein